VAGDEWGPEEGVLIHRWALDSAPSGIVISDLDGRLRYMNPAAMEMWGIDALEEVRGRSAPDVLPLDEDVIRDTREVGAWRGEIPINGREEGARALTRGSWMGDENDRPVALIFSTMDVTCRKEDLGRALNRERELLRKVFDRIPVMLLFYCADAGEVVVNEEFQQVMGWTGDELETPSRLLYRIPDREERRRVIDALFNRREQWVDVTVENRRGEMRSISWSTLALTDGMGVSIGLDMTRRKEIEERATRSEKLQLVGQLAGGIAHDFSNLLTVISGYGQLLERSLEDDGSDPVQRAVREILRSADTASALIQQLLTFSRRDMVRPQVVSVNEVLEGMREMLRRLVPEDVALCTDLDPLAGRVLVDPGELEQVILNLVVNARDAMDDGGILTITTGSRETSSAEGWSFPDDGPSGKPVEQLATLEVRDTGRGIAPEHMGRLFEPFFTTKEEGTGLGLATVYGIVDRIGGKIAVESTRGEGTAFTVSLPRMTSRSERRWKPPARSRPVFPSGKGVVLLVEDDPEVRGLVSRVLTRSGYQVVETGNGREALERFRSLRHDIRLVISDIVMPEMRGTELLDRIRRVDPRLPVILISGYPDQDPGEIDDLYDADLFLRKPFTPEQILTAVQGTQEARAGEAERSSF